MTGAETGGSEAAADGGPGPAGTALLFENERVRVWEMALEPGATCAPHRHGHDYLMIYCDASAIRSRLDSGATVIQHLEPGMVAYRAVGRAGLPAHQIENAGPAVSRHFVVELLGPSAAGTAQPSEHNGRGRTEPEPGQAS